MNSEAVLKAEHTGVTTGQGQMRQQIDAASLSQDLVAKCPVTSQSSIRSLPRNSDLDTVSLSEVLEAPSKLLQVAPPLLPVSLQVTFTPLSLSLQAAGQFDGCRQTVGGLACIQPTAWRQNLIHRVVFAKSSIQIQIQILREGSCPRTEVRIHPD